MHMCLVSFCDFSLMLTVTIVSQGDFDIVGGAAPITEAEAIKVCSLWYAVYFKFLDSRELCF